MIEEIHRRHLLWNELVGMEHTVRCKVRELLTLPNDPIPPLIERLNAVRKEIKDARKKERSGKVDISDLQDKIKELKIQITDARTEQAIAKAQVTKANRSLIDELEHERRAEVKVATKRSGLYWCNYEEIVNNYEQSRRKAMRDKTELKFHRWDGTGKITVRLKGLPVSAAFEKNTMLQIDPVSEEAWAHPIRSTRRKLAQTKIRLRITSDENKKPVWIELPMVMHRPLPTDSEIRSASIVREKVGRKWRYKAVITTTLTECRHMHSKGIVAINLGWRKVADGLRVAYWADDSGEHGQLLLGPEVLYEFKKCEELQSIRDKHFNEIKIDFTKYLSEPVKNMPDWLRDGVNNLSQWRSHGKLVSLVKQWQENRFDSDVNIFGKLSYWVKRENHLYDWETHLRDQVHRRRREIYRVFAAGLVRKYETVVLGDFDLRKVVKKPYPERGTGGSLPMNRQRFIAAVNELRLAIKNACHQAGANIKIVESKFVTIECHECGYIEKFDTSAQIWRTCFKCNALYDQDYNAAINYLHRFRRIRAL